MTIQTQHIMFKELIAQDFEIELSNHLSDEEVIQLVADQVALFMETRLEFFFNLLYRLDVDEDKISSALSPLAPEPTNIGIARLIVERQKQRAMTRQTFKQPAIAGWGW